MAWQDDCDSLISRYRASRFDEDLNDVEFDVDDEKMKASRTILSMASPVLKTQFYGSLAVKMGICVPINDGTARGFKAMLDFIYKEGEYSIMDLLDGKEEITECDDLRKVMELLYFGHKYQINSLVSFVRNILFEKIKVTDENVIKLHILAVRYKTILNAEYSIIHVHTKEFFDKNFRSIFKCAKITDENFIAEDLMVGLLQRQTLMDVSEEFVLQVTLDYVRFCRDVRIERGWRKMAKRIIPKVIDFTKLSLKAVDLTELASILPADLLLKLQTKMIEAYKNGLVNSEFRYGREEDLSISIVKTPLKQLAAEKRSQIKFKVNQSCFFTLNGSSQCRKLNHFGKGSHAYYGHCSPTVNCQCIPYKNIVWKQEGSMKEVAEGITINTKKFFAEPNTEITVQFEMRESIYTYMLEDSKKGKFKNGDVELEIIEVNEQPFNKAVDRVSRKKKSNQKAVGSSEGIHVASFSFCLL